MKPETQEWVDKAENDRTAAQRLMQPPNPIYDAVCFHAQRCAEKYLKAFLEEQSIPIEKTHDLTKLLDKSDGQIPELDPLRPASTKLGDFAVIPRYRGFHASQQQAEEALKIAEKVRSVVKAKLKLP